MSVSKVIGFTCAALVVLAGFGNSQALAQESAARPEGIAFVILGRIFRESRYIGVKRDQVNAEFAEREDSLRKKIEEREKYRSGLDKDRISLTAAQLDEQTDRIEILNIEIKRQGRDLEEDKRIRFDAVNRELEKEVFATIEQVANRKNTYIVFELSSVLFAEKSMDITADVIELLDVQLDQAQ